MFSAVFGPGTWWPEKEECKEHLRRRSGSGWSEHRGQSRWAERQRRKRRSQSWKARRAERVLAASLGRKAAATDTTSCRIYVSFSARANKDRERNAPSNWNHVRKKERANRVRRKKEGHVTRQKWYLAVPIVESLYGIASDALVLRRVFAWSRFRVTCQGDGHTNASPHQRLGVYLLDLLLLASSIPPCLLPRLLGALLDCRRSLPRCGCL